MSPNPTPPVDPNPAPAPKPKRSLFAFFFKSALGCTAFAFGVLVVLVLLLPTIASGPAKGIATDAFADRYQGKIEIAHLDLGWFSEQKVDGFVLRDPEGKEVVRGSAVLPSLLGLFSVDDGKIGRVRLDVDADLVQDDAGVTNLQRALAERHPSAPSQPDARDSGEDPLRMLSRLDLDLHVTSKKLAWSDKETRRVGIPFEVRDLDLTVKARPGAPLGVHANGKVVSERPGALSVDATLGGPIDVSNAWPFGKVDASVRIEGFSTAMIDGVANQQGHLVEVLGNRFTLNATANGLSPTAGNLELALDGERAGISLTARFDDGVLRSTDKGGLVASFPAPRGYLTQYVQANLPQGTKLVLDDASTPWTLTATNFALPLPPSGASDRTVLMSSLERAALDLHVAVPNTFTIENTMTREAGVQFAVRALQTDVKLAPGEPLVVRSTAGLDAGGAGTFVVDVSARDPWKKLGAGELPIVDLDLQVKDLATAPIGALAGQAERLTSAIGSTLQIAAEARNVSLDAGTMHLSVTGREGAATRCSVEVAARVEGGMARIDGANPLSVRLSPSPEWLGREIAALAPAGSEIVVSSGQDAITLEAVDVVVPMPDAKGGAYIDALRKSLAGTVTLRVAGASYADPALKAAKTRVTTSGLSASAKLQPGGSIQLDATGAFEQGASNGKFVAQASTGDVFEFAKKDPAAPLPRVDASVVVTNLPCALVDAFVQHANVVERTLGERLSLALYAKGANTTSGTLRFEVEAPNAKVSLSGRVDAGVFKATGEDVLHVDVKVPAAVVAGELGDALPAGTVLKWPYGVAAVTLDARDVSVPLPKPGDARPFDLGATLDGLAAKVNLALGGVGLENAQTKASKIDVAARDVVVEAAFAPKAPATVKARASLSPGKDAQLRVEATIADPFAVVKGTPMKPVDGTLELSGLDTNAIDALAGQEGALAGLLGPDLRLQIGAKNASASSGTLTVDASSAAMKLAAGARFDASGLHVSGNDSVALTITPAPAFVSTWTKKTLPAGTQIALAPDAGPLTLKVRDVAIPMPKPNEETTALQRLSKVAFQLEAALPSLVYSDSATTAAGKPVTVSGVRIASTFAPGAPPFAKLSGTIVDDPAGEIAADVRALDPLTKLAETNGKDTFRVKIDVKANRVPTAIADVLAHQNGLLVEALGTRLDLTVSAPQLTLQSGAFEVDMHSDLHGVKGKGHVEDGTVVIDQVDGLVATVGLGPVMSQRVVGKLVPTLVNVSKPAAAAPAKFSVDSLRFPLDGNLRKLDGVVRVDLGEVNYSLFPKLASFFNESGSVSALKIPALTVPISKGVAGYERLPVMIGGKEYMFSGTYDIVTDAAQLTANVPVNMLGKKVSAELEKVREYVDPKTTIPLTIKGSIKNPSVGIDDKALLKVLKDAGEKALEGAAGGLLDDLLKKKKKKD